MHVRDSNLAMSTDEVVWRFAKTNGFAIVSKDADLHELSVVFGFPPKVIWIRRGNCSTETIAELLKSHYEDITSFSKDKDNSCLILR